jgi:glycogen synthase
MQPGRRVSGQKLAIDLSSMAVPGSRTSAPTFHVGMGWFPEQPGGLNRYYYEAMQHLPRAGVRATGIVAGSPGVAFSSKGQVTAFASPTAMLPLRLRRARQAGEQAIAHDPDAIVVSHFAAYTFPFLDRVVGGQAGSARGREKALIVHFHGPWAAEGKVEGASMPVVWAKKTMERAVYSRARLVLTLSKAFAEVVTDLYAVRPDRIRVIPGAVEASRFASGGSGAKDVSDARVQLGWGEGRPVVLTVRRLVRRMGLEDLLSATAAIRRRIPDVLIAIVGKGPLAGELAAKVKEWGLKDHVKLQGFLPDELLPWAYRAATLSVVPSSAWEGFGLVAAESLAAGTPVLVSPVGGLPEVVQDLSTRLVLPSAADARVLAEAITAALDGSLQLPDSESCRRFAASKYDWPVVAARLREAYADVAV